MSHEQFIGGKSRLEESKIERIQNIGREITLTTKRWSVLRLKLLEIIRDKPDIADFETQVGYSDAVSDLTARLDLAKSEVLHLTAELEQLLKAK